MLFKSATFGSLLLLCSTTLAAAVPVTPEPGLVRRAKDPIKYWNCSPDQQRRIGSILGSAADLAQMASRQIDRPQAPLDQAAVDASFNGWFKPTHKNKVRSILDNIEKINDTDMTLHIYCKPESEEDPHPNGVPTGDAAIEWARNDDGAPELPAADARKDEPDGCATSYAFVSTGTNRLYICQKFWDQLEEDSLPDATQTAQIEDICKKYFIPDSGKAEDSKLRTVDSKFRSFVILHELTHTIKVAQGTGIQDKNGAIGTADDQADFDKTIVARRSLEKRAGNGYGYTNSRKPTYKNYGFQNAESYPWVTYSLWMKAYCIEQRVQDAGIGSSRKRRGTQIDCGDAKRQTTKARRSLETRALADDLEQVCNQSCPTGTTERLVSVLPVTGKGAGRKQRLCVSSTPCAGPGKQEKKFIQITKKSDLLGLPLVRETCDADPTKDNDKDARKEEIEQKKQELEQRKEQNANAQDARKDQIRQDVRDKNKIPGGGSDGKDDRCKGKAKILCEAVDLVSRALRL